MTNAVETKHTPGPWKFSATHPAGDFCIHAKGIPQQLAYVPASTVYEWPLEANARLIAAAPDLLASLQDAAKRLKGAGMLADDDEILAAISKATGSQA